MIKQIVIPLRYRYLGTLLIWVMTFLLLFAGADFRLENNVWVSDGLTTLVSLIGFALCAGLFLRMIFRFAAGNKPALLISRDGLFFCSPYGAKYYMPWNEIKEIRSTPLSLFQFLYIFREKKPVIAIQGMVLAVPLDEVLRDIYQSGYYKGVIAGWSPESSAKPKTREKTKLKISYHSKVSAFERVGFMTLLLTAGAFSSFKLSSGFNYGGAAMLLIMITGWAVFWPYLFAKSKPLYPRDFGGLLKAAFFVTLFFALLWGSIYAQDFIPKPEWHLYVTVFMSLLMAVVFVLMSWYVPVGDSFSFFSQAGRKDSSRFKAPKEPIPFKYFWVGTAVYFLTMALPLYFFPHINKYLFVIGFSAVYFTLEFHVFPRFLPAKNLRKRTAER